MKAKLLVVSLSLIIAAACSKEKFGTNPTLTFESVNGTSFAAGQTVTIKLRLTDKEGDFYADTSSAGFTKPYLYYQRYSYLCQNEEDTVPTPYEIPVFTTNKFLDVRLDINYTYGTQGQYPTLNGCTSRPGNDSTYLKMWILDDAGHSSDTITTPVLQLLQN